MSFPRTVSVALLTACAVIFFVAVPAAEPAGVASAQLPQPDPSGQATPSREQGPAIRIPRQQASSIAAVDGMVRSSTVTGGSISPLPASRRIYLHAPQISR
jgi:hypothetical protein